jgi:hypothetical protein
MCRVKERKRQNRRSNIENICASPNWRMGYGNYSQPDVTWSFMLGTLQIHSARLRALCGVIALLIGSISAPISLAGMSSDVCSMACCVEDGRCCCSPPRASVKGQAPDDGPKFSEAEVIAPCPDGCANPTPSKTLAGVTIRAASQPVHFTASTALGSEQIISDHVSVDLDSSSPRGPPLQFTPVA